ncbi:MAG: PRC-barrel domain-containing protein [Bradyrhizobiaceae bacterium]|nr:PRC-barrel domain-containing protein [Bradyrhizobiaceae bacterium]
MVAKSPSASREALGRRETVSLIGSDKVEGTAVYRADGTKIGRIERVMIEKVSGEVAYAVMSFGGFMGIGEDYYPLPWSALTYNPELDGYEVNVSEEQLKGAPRFTQHETWDWSSPDRAKTLHDYYGTPSMKL